jgi:hypothetical protein
LYIVAKKDSKWNTNPKLDSCVNMAQPVILPERASILILSDHVFVFQIQLSFQTTTQKTPTTPIPTQRAPTIIPPWTSLPLPAAPVDFAAAELLEPHAVTIWVAVASDVEDETVSVTVTRLVVVTVVVSRRAVPVAVPEMACRLSRGVPLTSAL